MNYITRYINTEN